MSTGYYYVRARYFLPELGRFAQRDPIGIWLDRINIGNGYTFAGNDLINNIDPTGRWYYKVHEKMMDSAFPNAPKAWRKRLKDASWAADTDQSAESAYKHAMRAPWQSREVAQKLWETFICEQAFHAAAAAAAGNYDGAVDYLGHALHAMQDSTSPVHAGFQVWGGSSYAGALLEGALENTFISWLEGQLEFWTDGEHVAQPTHKQMEDTVSPGDLDFTLTKTDGVVQKFLDALDNYPATTELEKKRIANFKNQLNSYKR